MFYVIAKNLVTRLFSTRKQNVYFRKTRSSAGKATNDKVSCSLSNNKNENQIAVESRKIKKFGNYFQELSKIESGAHF
jgi:hypothetical protein